MRSGRLERRRHICAAAKNPIGYIRIPMPSPISTSVTEREIRAEILLSLAELYRDPLSRSQYKRFAFRPAEQPLADQVLRDLSAHLVIEIKLPNVVRLTDLGFRLIEPELERLPRSRRSPPPNEIARGFGVAPPNDLVERVSQAVGGADFVMATQLIEGRFVVDWASANFEVVTGYTVPELEQAGGWPAIVIDMPELKLRDRLQEIVGGSKLSSEVNIRTKAGRVIRLRHESWPLTDPGGTRVVGTISGMRRVPRTG